MKVALVVCILAATAVAAPRYKRATRLSPTLGVQVKTAEEAWTAAEAETDPAKQPAVWEKAAAAFADVDGAAVDKQVKHDAAYAAVLAWKNALDEDPRAAKSAATGEKYRAPRPRPLPAREESYAVALARFASYADATEPELPGVLYAQANVYWRFDQLDQALPIFLAIVERFPRAGVAEHSANLAFDSYNRLSRYEEANALANRLAKNAALLDGRNDLAERIRQFQRAGLRMQAEKLERAARDSQDFDAWHAVGKAYLDIYNAQPDDPHNDEVLYNAAVTFEQGRSISVAIQTYLTLERQFPNSKITARATARLGRLYGDIAMYDKAAEKLEQYAKRYAGEKDSYDAMSDAVFYRKALGDRAKAIEDTNYFVKAYGSKKPAAAAAAFWSLGSFYESDPDAAIKHLREYVRTFGTKGGADKLAIANAKIGLLLWAKSCPHKTLDGLCVKEKQAARTCGPSTLRALVATPRNAKTTAEALAAFAEAIKIVQRNAPTDDEPTLRYFHSQALLALADAKLESYLALAFPTGLTFPPKDKPKSEASQKRLAEWLDTKQRSASTAVSEYEKVLALKDAAGSITAAGRIATITHAFALQLLTSELPRELRGSPEGTEAYCSLMIETAEPLEAKALDSYGVCLAKSQELSWFAESTASCERALLEMKPDEYPALHELRAPVTSVATVVASEPPVR